MGKHMSLGATDEKQKQRRCKHCNDTEETSQPSGKFPGHREAGLREREIVCLDQRISVHN
jgi:hypothetical protein